MKRVAWITDIHLNFLEPAATAGYLARLVELAPDAVLLSGDISESVDLPDYLRQIATLPMPVYFVLGNHDYYFGSIARVRAQVQAICREHAHLVYLTASDPVELTPAMGLVGHDGWADARLGDYERSLVMMNDYLLIEELAGYSKAHRQPRLRSLGDEAAAHIRRVLPRALERYPQVMLVTHVPPLREACWHEGQISNDEWAPHFTCKAVGDVLLELMPRYPQRQLTVLCGHTHSPGETRPLPNLTILTGGAKYGEPRIERVFEIE